MTPAIHPATWRLMRGIYRTWYARRPELTLTDWLSDMRRAHAALLGEDANRRHALRVDRYSRAGDRFAWRLVAA